MQIVIDIQEDDYRKVQDGRASVAMMRNAIRNGTPLEQEPKTGRWLDVDGIFFKCSECDAYRKMMPAYKEYYCPNCGAKMQ